MHEPPAPAFAWSDFFGDRLGQILERWTAHLGGCAEEYRGRLVASVTSMPDLPADVAANLDGIFRTTDKILGELLAQSAADMRVRIEQDQRSLYETVPGQVEANMQEAFREAAAESGKGMKQRMVEILSRRARRVSEVMFDDAREAIQSGLRSLNDWLGCEYAKMTEAVRRNAELAGENLIAGGDRLSVEAIGKEQERLDRLDELVAAPTREEAT